MAEIVVFTPKAGVTAREPSGLCQHVPAPLDGIWERTAL